MNNFLQNKLILASLVGVLTLAGVGGYMMVDEWYQDGLRFQLEASAGAVPVEEFFGQHAAYEDTQEFASTDGRFRFSYPANHALEQFQEAASGYTVRIDSGEVPAAEVHINSIDPRRDLGTRLVRQRLETEDIGPIREIIAGSAGPGVAFDAQVPYFAGTSTQVWFRQDDQLIQVRANRAGRPLLRQIVESWEWNTAE